MFAFFQRPVAVKYSEVKDEHQRSLVEGLLECSHGNDANQILITDYLVPEPEEFGVSDEVFHQHDLQGS